MSLESESWSPDAMQTLCSHLRSGLFPKTVCFLRLVQRHTLLDVSFPIPDQVPRGQQPRLGPLLGDTEVAELVDEESVRGELRLAGRLDGPEGGRPAGRGMPILLLGAEAGHA